jgi:hypothetical protein
VFGDEHLEQVDTYLELGRACLGAADFPTARDHLQKVLLIASKHASMAISAQAQAEHKGSESKQQELKQLPPAQYAALELKVCVQPVSQGAVVM